ncbi:hypothetical protein M5K25_008063 [Dendrobium thyrsiflorum]|uniref:Uncharacterized protein n=1 Tax=Dendrobium thyrsiflorum TaxID=117978 RepID=A0ABD0V879_DENTH
MPPLLPPPSFLLIPTLLLLSLKICITLNLSEKETLFSIMESISSDKDWRSFSPEPCKPSSSWPGMECKPGSDKLLHVTKLVFGTPPNPTCMNSATFPSQIFNLPSLQSIHFVNCFKTKKTTLFFPNSHSSSLQQLSLRSNPALISLIPPQISSLKSLQVLTLSQNHLYGKIPDSISTLNSLIHLDLSYNSLTGRIPVEIWRLNNLIDLDLSYNSLTGPIPPSIGEMVKLQNLDLSSNSLTETIPESVEKLKMLTFLALSDNKLSGYDPNGVANLQKLEYLIMEGNPMFIPLPPELGRLPRLQELRLGSSGYSGMIPKSFCWLKNLTSLSLEKNNLSGEIPPEFNGLRKIYHLNLSRNLLSGVVPFSSEFFKRLGRNLDLSGNGRLCVNEYEELNGNVGVGLCGRNGSSSVDSDEMRKPLESSAIASSALGIWLWRSGAGFMGFSAVYFCLWSF